MRKQSNKEYLFGKGHIPWNKGIKVDRNKHPNMGHFKKHTKETIEKIRKKQIEEQLRGEMSPHWKGDKVGYRALHNWIESILGKPMKCEFCGVENKSRYHWANISGEYKRDKDDWVRLCVKCHSNYDYKKRGGLYAC